MPRRARRELPDGRFHVTTRGVCNALLFVDDEDRRIFLWLLGEVAARHDVRCLAYCLMGTHYHLVLECRTAALSPAMRRLNGRYARRYNDRHHRYGHVFGERYSSFVIRDQDHYDEVLRYVAGNPVEAKLCVEAEDWPWTWIADGGVYDHRAPSVSIRPALLGADVG
jgi:putative transposase